MADSEPRDWGELAQSLPVIAGALSTERLLTREEIYDALVEVQHEIDNVASRIDSLPPALIQRYVDGTSELLAAISKAVQRGIA